MPRDFYGYFLRIRSASNIVTKRFLFRFMYTKYYRFGFGSGSLAQNFKDSGSVQVDRFEILKVRVWFRFTDLIY